MPNADLERFRLKLREYRLLVNRTQGDLAAYLNLDYNELSSRLNAHKNARLSHDNVRTLVRALAEWGAITTRGQAEEMLDLMFCPHFDPVDLQARPLSKLAASPNANPQTLSTTIKNPNFEVSPPTPTISTRQKLPTPATPEPAHNLPQQLSSFIGRNKEVAELKKLLAQDTVRLVTLVGAGGCGKTRLSLQVAAELAGRFPEGVWLVELAPLSDPALVAQTIATTLGLVEQAARPILATLSDYLRTHSLLLVLDNCEHLVEECARVVDTLIRASKDLHILATSREALGLPGEVTFRVPSLSLPNPNSLPEAQTLLSSEAVSLFMERAVAVNPAFTLTRQNAEAVALVCRHLDGIPLAIELAAARIKVLPIGQLASRLDERFRLLTGGSRTALPRQQTLKALVDWSFELLTPAEQTLLVRLSVFAGGWRLNAAEEVCSGADLEKFEVLDALGGLVNKSLAQLEEDNGEARYYFLETIRQYGLEKLKARGEEQALQERHLTYFAGFATELTINVENQGQLEALKQLDLELDNIRAAIDYGLKVEHVGPVVKLCAGYYWDIRGYYSEWRRYLEQLLTLSATSGINRGWVLFYRCFVSYRQGDGETSHHYAEECLSLSKEYDDKELLLMALYVMAHKHAELGKLYANPVNLAKARGYFEEALSLSEEMSNLVVRTSLKLELGMGLVEQGELSGAQQLFVEIAPLARAANNQSLVSMILGAQARLALVVEDTVAAHQYLQEMYSVSDQIGYQVAKIDALCYRGLAWTNEGKFEEARRSLDESLVMCMKGTLKNITANSLVGVARLLSRVWLKDDPTRQPEKIACLCGATWALQSSPGSKEPLLIQPMRKYYHYALGIVRSSLGEADFEEAFGRGRAMSMEEAIGYARQVLSEF